MDIVDELESLNPEPTLVGNPGPEHPNRGKVDARRWRALAGIAVSVVIGSVLMAGAMENNAPIELRSSPAPSVLPLSEDSHGGRVPLLQDSIDDPSNNVTAAEGLLTWQATSIGQDPPVSLQLWDLADQARRYAGLVSDAEQRLARPCMAAAGFDLPTLSEGPPSYRPRPYDFELSPFASDGGYRAVRDFVRTDPLLGAILDPRRDDTEQRRLAEALGLCLGQSRQTLFGDPHEHTEFISLVGVVAELPGKAIDLVDQHQQAIADRERWSDCMGTANAAVSSRAVAINIALGERLDAPRSGRFFDPESTPGAQEQAFGLADRRCSATLGYSRQRSAALAAAERHILANDGRAADIVRKWTTTRRNIDESVRRHFDAELLSLHRVTEYVATGEPVESHFATRIGFEQAFLAEAVLCLENDGLDAAAMVDFPPTYWNLPTILDAERSRLATQGMGIVLAFVDAENAVTVTEYAKFESCGQRASTIVSPSQRLEATLGYNAFYRSRDDDLGFSAGLEMEWFWCMEAEGIDGFLSPGELGGFTSSELIKQIQDGELTPDEALEIEIELTTASFECRIAVDFDERWRLFAEETAQAFLADS